MCPIHVHQNLAIAITVMPPQKLGAFGTSISGKYFRRIISDLIRVSPSQFHSSVLSSYFLNKDVSVYSHMHKLKLTEDRFKNPITVSEIIYTYRL
jgi:hypothetical protein